MAPTRTAQPAAPARTRRRRRRRSRVIARGALLAVLCLVVGTGTFVGGLLAAPIDFTVAPPPTAALLLAADGRQLATLQPPERFEVVKAADIPQVMRNAIISAEDERFLKHSGVDPLATIRAVFRDLTGGVSQGGSTLTQQYVKNAYVGNERSALRKIREAALAIRLEQKLSKQEILTDYLNALYLGNGLYGVQAASKYYFGVQIKDLDVDRSTGHHVPILGLARASMLAGIAPAPSVWNPVKDFHTARIRQQYTLNRMVVGGFASPQEVSDAFHEDVTPLRISPKEPPNPAPEFVDYLTAKLRADPSYDEDRFFRGGLQVKTTIDLDLQQAFTEALAEVLNDPVRDPQAAIVAVDYVTGDIKAMATRRRVPERVSNTTGAVTRKEITGYEPKLGFNLATNAQRSTGSTIKPFTLAQALLEGQSLSTARYAPNCLSIPNPGGRPNPYRFCNSDKSEAGTFSLRRALADSVNTVYLPLAKEVGRGKVATLAEKAGLVGSIKSGNLSFGIGAGVEVTPLSEAVAFGTLANGGTHVSPRSYTEIRTGATSTDPGELLTRPAPKPGQRVMPKTVADDVVTAMTDVVRYGTATTARQPFPVFGKTGTTNDSTDAWFTGCIPSQRICVATWMGYEDIVCQGTSTHVVGPACGGMKNLHGFRQVFGGTLPARIFARSQELLRQIQADRRARARGLVPPPHPTSTPSPTPAVAVTPSAVSTPRPSPTRVPPTTSPTPSPTPAPTLVPTVPPPSSSSPSASASP